MRKIYILCYIIDELKKDIETYNKINELKDIELKTQYRLKHNVNKTSLKQYLKLIRKFSLEIEKSL